MVGSELSRVREKSREFYHRACTGAFPCVAANGSARNRR
jgi:hypothetical protein